ncbi:hypothetical protein [Fortiea contorta]|uniref:hypothetical protein n=1 Tax=Fortiea contorta TaxID=1892405 RepID=UPI00034691A2|nr:hypothetical protein [Fortiea contorta]
MWGGGELGRWGVGETLSFEVQVSGLKAQTLSPHPPITPSPHHPITPSPNPPIPQSKI